MAVDWLKIRNEYINGGGSYRELSKKYDVPLRTIAKHAKDEEWPKLKEENCNAIATTLRQKTADAIVKKELSRFERLLDISDSLLDKIEQAVTELDMAQVTNKKKTKVIEYNNHERPDKPTKEIIEEEEEILSVQSIIDRRGLQQVAMALKAVFDMTAEENASDEESDDGFLEALNGTAGEDWSDESESDVSI